MYKLIYWIRYRLLKLLAGKSSVMINVGVKGGTLELTRGLVVSCRFDYPDEAQQLAQNLNG